MELNPPRSLFFINSDTFGANSLNVGSFSTISSEIPWIAVVTAGIFISGLTRQVKLSLFPLGKTFNIDISTIRSFETFTPVVSKSKKQMGFFNFNSMMNFYTNKYIEYPS